MAVSKRAKKQALKIYNKILNETEDPEVLEALWEILDEELHVTYL
jgi:hypothetical protein